MKNHASKLWENNYERFKLLFWVLVMSTIQTNFVNPLMQPALASASPVAHGQAEKKDVKGGLRVRVAFSRRDPSTGERHSCGMVIPEEVDIKTIPCDPLLR